MTDVLGDAIDDSMIADGEEEESEEFVSQVLDELGCNIDAQLLDAPSGKKERECQKSRHLGWKPANQF